MSEATSKRWSAGWAIVSIFAVYISLVPFGFVDVPSEGVVGHAVASLEWETRSLSNVVANGLMFVPFGFCGVAAMVGRQPLRGSRWLTAALICALSLLLSLSIEAAQAYLPQRTPSWTDVTAQMVGTLNGFLLWKVATHPAVAVAVRSRSGPFARPLILGGAYAALYLVVAVVDPSVASRRAEALPSTLSGLFLGIPLGVLVAWWGACTHRWSPTRSAFVGLVFVLGAETMRAAFWGSVDTHAIDVIPAGVGVAVGAAVVQLLTQSRAVSHRRVMVVILIAFAALGYAVHNLAPFDFVLSGDMARGRLARLWALPFQGYYQNPEFKALRDILVKAATAFPLGVLFHAGWRCGDRVRQRLWLAATIGYFAVIELGQVLLPSRYPDNSDIILAACAVWIGMRAVPPVTVLPRSE